jgi:hypothetical protein
MTREEFEAQARQLLGQVVQRVRYCEIAYDEGTPFWCGDPRFDSLDFGLDLLTVSGERFSISWGAEFYQYGVSLAAGLPEAYERSRVWDVSETSRWRDLLGQRIEDVHVFWSWVEWKEGFVNHRVHYPQDVKLVFENGREVYLCAFEVWTDGSTMGMIDHITVFFDEALAHQFGVGLETPG